MNIRLMTGELDAGLAGRKAARAVSDGCDQGAVMAAVQRASHTSGTKLELSSFLSASVVFTTHGPTGGWMRIDTGRMDLEDNLGKACQWTTFQVLGALRALTRNSFVNFEVVVPDRESLSVMSFLDSLDSFRQVAGGPVRGSISTFFRVVSAPHRAFREPTGSGSPTEPDDDGFIVTTQVVKSEASRYFDRRHWFQMGPLVSGSAYTKVERDLYEPDRDRVLMARVRTARADADILGVARILCLYPWFPGVGRSDHGDGWSERFCYHVHDHEVDHVVLSDEQNRVRVIGQRLYDFDLEIEPFYDSAWEPTGASSLPAYLPAFEYSDMRPPWRQPRWVELSFEYTGDDLMPTEVWTSVDGVRHGISMWFDDEHKLVSAANFSDGLRHGFAIQMNGEGRLHDWRWYIHGKLIHVERPRR